MNYLSVFFGTLALDLHPIITVEVHLLPGDSTFATLILLDALALEGGDGVSGSLFLGTARMYLM